ncbi:vWA domain-containing protein [Sneathiella sp. HT1-7]|uniref:vWA domain-containing protein n=1 Tax=Sneathiella sp. HT1-7 TaxID=2887192 RepID=UPI001D13A6D3|nr:vWA domain-containing protein [Sneathiella sp. HT1-7]MCC3305197.1 hypothetical protein [Sneathiella sp. HT1-7]
MRKRRETEGVSLSFLDIMSCGLGAAVLILILLKLQPDQSAVDVDALKKELEVRHEKAEELQVTLEQDQLELEALNSRLASLAGKKDALTEAINNSTSRMEEKVAEIKSVTESIVKKPPLQKADPVQSDQGGEEEYLLGLKVEGKRIAFLIDTSASMTDEKLVDIIGRKVASDAEKKQGPKWRRTIRTVKWLANRIPKKSQAKFVGFNEKVFAIGPSSWFSGSDAAAIESVFQRMENVVPEGATNLEAVLESVNGFSDAPTDYYLVTDGLPTAGTSNFVSLNPFSNCNSLFGKSATISGDCRLKLFQYTIRKHGIHKGRPVNVVLLPLEGDPKAAPAFWSWTFSTNGLMISPAESWP